MQPPYCKGKGVSKIQKWETCKYSRSGISVIQGEISLKEVKFGESLEGCKNMGMICLTERLLKDNFPSIYTIHNERPRGLAFNCEYNLKLESFLEPGVMVAFYPNKRLLRRKSIPSRSLKELSKMAAYVACSHCKFYEDKK